MSKRKFIVAVLLLGSMLAIACGCRKEGPAERAGKEIDRSVERAGKEIEKAGDKMKDVLDTLKK